MEKRKKIIRREIYEKKERKEEGKSERDTAPHTLAAHAHKSRGCSSSFPSLCCSTQIDQASKKHCSHTRGRSITRHHCNNSQKSILHAGGKYTQVSKGKVHQSFMFISTWAEFIKSCFLYLCLYALVWMFSYGTSIGF